MITCQLCRRAISNKADAVAPLPRWAERHVGNCSACREFRESITTIARELPAAAASDRKAASPFLHRRIMSAIAHPPAAQELSQSQGHRAWTIAALAACLVMAAVVWMRRPQAPDTAPTSSVPPANELALNVKLPDGAELKQWTNVDGSLETEAQLVLDDARRALESLKKSFVPKDLLASLSSQPSQ